MRHKVSSPRQRLKTLSISIGGQELHRALHAALAHRDAQRQQSSLDPAMAPRITAGLQSPRWPMRNARPVIGPEATGDCHLEPLACRVVRSASTSTTPGLTAIVVTDTERLAGSRAKKSTAPPPRQPDTAACTAPASVA